MSIAKNTIINIIAATIPLLVGILTVPPYLKTIGPEKYGFIAIILSIQSYFSFMDLGLGKATTLEISKSQENNYAWHNKIYWTASIAILFIGLTGSIFTLLATEVFFYYKNIENSKIIIEEIKEATEIAILCIPILLLTSINIGALQAKNEFKVIAKIQTSGSILSQLIPLTIAYYSTDDLRILVGSTLGTRIFCLLLLAAKCKKIIQINNKVDYDKIILKKLVRYGGWLSLINFLSPLLTVVDRMIIAFLRGPIAVSSYTIPYDLVSRTMIISTAASSALFPKLASSNQENGKSIAIKASEALNAIITPSIIIAILIFDPLLKLWINSDIYNNSTGVGEILLIGIWLNSLVIPYHANFLANHNPKKVAYIFIAEVPIYLSLLYIGITHYGVIGAAYAWTLRVLIDTSILLRLNNAIAHNLKSITISSIFILISILTAKINNNTEKIYASTTVVIAYILISLWCNKKIYVQIFSLVKFKN